MTWEKKRVTGKNYDLEKRTCYHGALYEKDLRIRKELRRLCTKIGKYTRYFCKKTFSSREEQE